MALPGGNSRNEDPHREVVGDTVAAQQFESGCVRRTA